MENFLGVNYGLNQGALAGGSHGTPEPLQGWTWDRFEDPLLPLGSLANPGALLSTSLDRGSPLRLSVVSLEDDQLRALAEELRRQGETVLVLDPSREGLNDLARTLKHQGRHYDEIQIFSHGADAVSYTHLTLPTIYSV